MTSTNNGGSGRRRKALAITGIVAAGLAVAGLGSYGVARALPAEFPPGTREIRIDFGRLAVSREEVRFRVVRTSRAGAAETIWSAWLTA